MDTVEEVDEAELADLRQAMNAQSQQPCKRAVKEAFLELFHYNANAVIHFSLHINDAVKFSLKSAARLELLREVILFRDPTLPIPISRTQFGSCNTSAPVFQRRVRDPFGRQLR